MKKLSYIKSIVLFLLSYFLTVNSVVCVSASEIAYLADGYYKISNISLKKAIEVQDSSLSEGADVVLNDFSNKNNQIFYLKSYPDRSYSISPAHSNLFLGVNPKNGKFIQSSWHGDDFQKFFFSMDLESGLYKIISKKTSNPLTIEDCLNDNLWKLEKTEKSKFKSYRLDVPLVPQRPELPTGCEITSLTMMLLYAGANVDKVALAEEMPRNNNPNFGYVGNPFKKSGWTIYPSALVPMVKKYSGNSIHLTGCSLKKLEEQISNGKPVVVWVSGMYGFTVHAILLTGFDETHYYFNDPWGNKKDLPLKKVDFYLKWMRQFKRAISY